MGNKLPRTYEEFERTFQKQENNLTGRERFIKMMQDKGVITTTTTANGCSNPNVNLFAAVFPEKNCIKESDTSFFNNKPPKGDYDSFGKSSVVSKQEAAMKIYVNLDWDDYSEEITISEPNELTCGWLLSEVTRRYEGYLNKRKESLTSMETDDGSRKSGFNSNKKPVVQKRLIVGLKWKPGSFQVPIDYYLTQHDLPLSRLPNGLELDIHFSNIGTSKKSFVKNVIKENWRVTEHDFDFLHVIGRGGYSKVVWARKKDSGRLYALKIMKKSDIDNNIISQRIVMNERDIQMKFNGNPFFLNLHWTFQNKNHFYLVTELCVGGSLYHLLNTHKALDEATIRFYASEILLMIQIMHDNNIIYRDLKPENILIDSEGHLKLADFGLAKIVESPTDLNDTFWGSPEYMAPEMLYGDSHNNTLDFYTFGCLLHEMVSEFPPYYSKNREQMNSRIMYNAPLLNFTSSPELKHLIKWCLNKYIDRRPQWVDDVMQHPFFRSVDWNLVKRRKATPPWVPSLVNHFNKKLTNILIVNNEIQEVDSPIKRFDSRASIYFEKINNEESEFSLYLMKQEVLRDVDAVNESFVSKGTFKTTKRHRSSTVDKTYIPDFEIAMEPKEEAQFRNYLKSMLQK